MVLAALAETADGGLIFANFVDFDTDYGHRRDVAGYALASSTSMRACPKSWRQCGRTISA